MPLTLVMLRKNDHGGALAAWLNSNFPPEAQARADISEAIREMNGLDAYYGLVRMAYEDWKTEPNNETAETFYEAQEHVRPPALIRLFRKVTPRPMLAPDATPFNKWEIQWIHDDRGDCSFQEAALIMVSGMNADRAIQFLVQLAERGLVGRIRECRNCHKWLYAKFERQRFCSDACREKRFRSSAEGKRKRKEYMRGYRARLKRMDKNRLKASARAQG